MYVIVGSKNPGKITAVNNVCTKFFPGIQIKMFSYNSSSNVPKQPIGLDIVINGAINRASNASEYIQSQSWFQDSPDVYFAVGIEAGLVPIPNTITGYLDFQFCAIMDQEKHLTLGSGSGWEYPPKVIQQVLDDPTLEIGTIMAEISGDSQIKYKNGAIGYYSKNILSRPIITEQCVEMALIPFLNKEDYFTNQD
jgi:inosine/xanthosine triphosphatase